MTDRESRERLIELIEQGEGLKNNDFPSIGELADHFIANGAIVLPCKLGSYIYYIGNNNVQKMHISYAELSNAGITMSAECMDEHNMCDVVCDSDKTCDIGFDYSHVGKTVFLTKEEAEKALAERNK